MRSVLFLFALVAAPPLAAQSTDLVVSPDTLFFPEGIDADARTGTFYVTSIHHRSVLVVPPGGTPRWLFDPTVARTGAVTGVALDTARDVAWVTTARHPQMRALTNDTDPPGELLAIRLADGLVTARHTLGDGTSTAGELALTPNGEVLVSDGLRGTLYRLAPGATSLVMVRHAALRSPQGIAVDAVGRIAWIADWSRGLLRWDLETDAITPVPLADGTLVRGMDGLRHTGTALVAVQNGAATPRIVRLALDADGHTITGLTTLDHPPQYPGEPTTGTVLDDTFVFIASSAWPFYTESGVRRPGTRPLPPVVLRAVPLNR